MEITVNEKKVGFSYETLGNSSYFVATLEEDFEPINYQMEMISNNEIPNILSANRHQKNNEVQIYYNVTSRISLTQAVSRKKMKKENFINIILSAIYAFNEINEYQLVNTGVILEPECIFVKSGSFDPSFVYLPVYSEDRAAERLKGFIIKMLMSNMIEVSNDNFVQILLNSMSSEALSLGDIEKIFVGLKKTLPGDDNKIFDGQRPQSSTVSNNFSVPPAVPEVSPVVMNKDEMAVSGTPRVAMGIPKGMQLNPKNKKSEKVKEKKSKEFSGRKLIMIGLQVLFAIIIFVLISSGALIEDETGGINSQIALTTVLVIGATDFIVYRELFKNKKSDGKKTVKKAAVPKDTKPVTGRNRIEIPGAPNVKSQAPIPQRENVNNNENMPSAEISHQQMQQPFVQPEQPPARSINTQCERNKGFNIDTDDTVVIDNNMACSGYLEHYNNGTCVKIPLDKLSIIIGRLKGQVDYIVENNKVGKIHAEFISRDGLYYVKDYNSTNGTYINGSKQRIVSNVEHQIFNNDRISLANSEFTLRC